MFYSRLVPQEMFAEIRRQFGKKIISVRLKVVYLCQVKGQNSEGRAELRAKIPYLGKENHRTADCERHLWRLLNPTTWFGWILHILSGPDGVSSAVLVKKFFSRLNGVFFISV